MVKVQDVVHSLSFRLEAGNPSMFSSLHIIEMGTPILNWFTYGYGFSRADRLLIELLLANHCVS